MAAAEMQEKISLQGLLHTWIDKPAPLAADGLSSKSKSQ